jgi:succinoglycan biosynthesis protein ExoM
MAAFDKTSVAVAVCTCNRNGPLEVLLQALRINAERLGERACIGVVVVDDSNDGKAQVVVERFEGQFELGIHYLRSGRQNISLARNMAIEKASQIASWVAMTDDDCEPCPAWLEAMLATQARTQADAISGLYRRRVPPGAPAWLVEEPFLEIAMTEHHDGAVLNLAGTNNSMISSAWWRAHPEVRFRPALGVTGGEDVVFYRSAHAAGLKICFGRDAVVFENEPLSRTTLAYQLWLFFWLGNGSYVTRRATRQTAPLRMVLQGGNQVRRAVQRSFTRLANRQNPQLRYCLAATLYGVGMMIGPLGVRIPHH